MLLLAESVFTVHVLADMSLCVAGRGGPHPAAVQGVPGPANVPMQSGAPGQQYGGPMQQGAPRAQVCSYPPGSSLPLAELSSTESCAGLIPQGCVCLEHLLEAIIGTWGGEATHATYENACGSTWV